MSRNNILVVIPEWERDHLPRLLRAAEKIMCPSSLIDVLELGYRIPTKILVPKESVKSYFYSVLEPYGTLNDGLLAVGKLVKEKDYGVLVFGDSESSLWLAGLIAGSYSIEVVTEVIDLGRLDGELFFKRPAYEESLVQEIVYGGEAPIAISVRTGAFKPKMGVVEEITPIQVEPGKTYQTTIQVRVKEIIGKTGGDLGKAKVVVGAGLGIEDPEKLKLVQRLAEILGGEWGVTRPLVDNGWAPRERMIGHSGVKISPQLYIALGISGAPYHVSGVSGAETIIAVNKDPGAPIFRVSDYGLVGDLSKVLPELIRLLEKKLGSDRTSS